MLAAVLLSGIGRAVAAEKGPVVSVESHSGVYDVRGSFTTHAPIATAWEVLTDYDKIPSYVSSMKESRVEGRSGDTLRVHQVAVVTVLLFHRDATVTLAVTESAPNRIEFVDMLGQDFLRYTGSWSLRTDAASTEVSYTLRAHPRTGPSGWFSRGVMSRLTSDLLAKVRAEIERRAARR
jgi:carbon monoxide dehydrogenase subunit G